MLPALLLSPASANANTPRDLIDNNNRQAVISAYLAQVKPALDTPVGWTGSVNACNAGDTSLEHKRATLGAINFMRAMVDLPPVSANSTLTKRAQASALIIEANKRLTHTPSSRSLCYTKDGYLGSKNGNIGLVLADGEGELKAAMTGARGVVVHMDDQGSHNASVGHRRWLLYSRLTQVGIGDTRIANTIVVIGGKLAPARKQWVAWPSAGYFPRELQPNGRWSLSYPGADFRKATISISTPDGAVQTTKQKVVNGYADNTLVWDMRLPERYYASTADYQVTVTVKGIRVNGKSVNRTYSVTIVDADPESGN